MMGLRFGAVVGSFVSPKFAIVGDIEEGSLATALGTVGRATVGDGDGESLTTTLEPLSGKSCLQHLQTTEIVMANHFLLRLEPLSAYSRLQELLQWEEVTENHLIINLEPLWGICVSNIYNSRRY